MSRTDKKDKIEQDFVIQLNVFEKKNVLISRLSYGIPMGAEIDYLDIITLDKALEDRKKIDLDFLSILVNGVIDNLEDIDKGITKYLENWNIERLGLTDQAIIRIAVYELVYTATPDLVCINEAIELSKNYSDEKVSKMINGVLDKIYREKLDTN